MGYLIIGPDPIPFLQSLIAELGAWNALVLLLGLVLVFILGWGSYKAIIFLTRLPGLRLEQRKLDLQRERAEHFDKLLGEYQVSYRLLLEAFDALAENLQVVISERRLETQVNYLLGCQKDFGSILKYKLLSYVEGGLKASVVELKQELLNVFESVVVKNIEQITMENDRFIEALEEYGEKTLSKFVDATFAKISEDSLELRRIIDESDSDSEGLREYFEFLRGGSGVSCLMNEIKEFVLKKYRDLVLRDRNLDYLRRLV